MESISDVNVSLEGVLEFVVVLNFHCMNLLRKNMNVIRILSSFHFATLSKLLNQSNCKNKKS